jgi:hypothetical protein
MRAATLLFYWEVAREDFFSLFGANRYMLFLKDLREALVELKVETNIIHGSDPLGEERLRALKEARQANHLQAAGPQRDEGSSSGQTRRKQGGNRRRRDARGREQQLRTIPIRELPPALKSMQLVRGNVLEKDFLPKKPARPARGRTRRSRSPLPTLPAGLQRGRRSHWGGLPLSGSGGE